jgi:hypothetical protein
VKNLSKKGRNGCVTFFIGALVTKYKYQAPFPTNLLFSHSFSASAAAVGGGHHW